MNVRKFFGSSTRDALSQVRDALGADALILSNRKVDGGVEIMAVADGDMEALTHQSQQATLPLTGTTTSLPKRAEPERQPLPAIGEETIAAILHRRQSSGKQGAIGPAQTVKAPVFETLRSTGEPSRLAQNNQSASYPMDETGASQIYSRPAVSQAIQATQVVAPQPASHGGSVKSISTEADFDLPRHSLENEGYAPMPSSAPDPAVAEMAREIKRMRSLLEGQLSGFAWGEFSRKEPYKAEILRTMFTSGFSPALSKKLVESMPAQLDYEKGLKWIKAALAHNIRVVEAGADLVDRGGIVALVGPTGVGKTTTVAKLAARAVLKFGVNNVALLTTDSYRIGAHEQLRIYGRILSVPVHSIRDDAELELTLADLQRSHLVLIDTVGMSQRDRRIAEQIEFLCGRGSRVQRQLLLPATAQGVTLDDIVRAYRGSGMDGCILTKLDESVALAPAVDCLVRYGLDLHYVTNGQRVPEDLHLANATYLVDRAFKGQASAATQLTTEEMALQSSWSATTGADYG